MISLSLVYSITFGIVGRMLHICCWVWVRTLFMTEFGSVMFREHSSCSELVFPVTKALLSPSPVPFITYVCVDCRKTTMQDHGITTNNNSDGCSPTRRWLVDYPGRPRCAVQLVWNATRRASFRILWMGIEVHLSWMFLLYMRLMLKWEFWSQCLVKQMKTLELRWMCVNMQHGLIKILHNSDV